MSSSDSGAATAASHSSPRAARSVSPRMRKLLYVVFAITGLLGANSLYLSGVTALEWFSGKVYQDYFYQYMFLAHLLFGLALIAPFIVFGVFHMLASHNRRNRRAVWIGYALFVICILVLVSGVLLMRVGGLDLKNPSVRSIVYWCHVACPIIAVWLYWLHRLVGPRIKWRQGLSIAAAVGAVVVAMIFLQAQDPREWNAIGSADGEKNFSPSPTRTSTGGFIPSKALMMDEYCKECHEDVYNDWFHSAHHASSFNNPAYLASVRAARKVLMDRDGHTKTLRWCAGCHDPVPFFAGEFDNPDYDDINDPTAHAGITCSACHAITHANSTRGNGDYTIEEPMHYPFTYSENSILKWVNHTLLKSKPSFHMKTFLKPLHKTAELCATCHKVHLPKALTGYKEFLRGQNHYDNYLLSGVSGRGARSFYYPEVADDNCNRCHMPLKESDDFSARSYAGSPVSVHDHLFPGGNTAIPWLRNAKKAVETQQEILIDCARIDIFGVREEGSITGELHAPVRPKAPVLVAGKSYLLETVIRTLTLGHLFTQGTVDSNEVWVEVRLRAGDRLIGVSGALDERGQVDRWAHYVNVFMLDKNGGRIGERNAADIFVPLYDHQIPPGAAASLHYGFTVPTDLKEPLTVEVKLNYRKFDREYMQFVVSTAKKGDEKLRGQVDGKPYDNPLPITVIASDRYTFAIEGGPPVENDDREIPAWQRWNDYGIGMLLKGKAELRQATAAFQQVEELGRFDGPLNLARVYEKEGLIDEAVEAIKRASRHDSPAAPAWTLAWISGVVNRQQGYLREAETNFRSVLEDRTEEMVRRKFDFSDDYVVINLLGSTLFDLGKQQVGDEGVEARNQYYRGAVEQFQKTLTLDSENVAAHYNLYLLFAHLGREEDSQRHRTLHARYRPDENARDSAAAAARLKYPWANHAAQSVVIYDLQRSDALSQASVKNRSKATTATRGNQ